MAWDEFSAGDLSDEPATPTDLGDLGIDTHTVRAEARQGDPDLFTFTVPAGHQLHSIFFASYNSDDPLGFLGLQAGSTWSTGVGAAILPSDLLGWAHIGSGGASPAIESEIIDDLANSAGAQGFTAPLPAGAYTFLYQQTDDVRATAIFVFGIEAAPVPPRITDISRAGTTLTVTFEGEANTAYDIRSDPDLQGGFTTTAATATTDGAGAGLATFTIALPGTLFVRVEPQ